MFSKRIINSLKSSRGAKDLKKASKSCKEFTDVCGLGGKVLSKYKPAIVYGKLIQKGAKFAKKTACKLLKTMAKWKKAYDNVAKTLRRFGIRI